MHLISWIRPRGSETLVTSSIARKKEYMMTFFTEYMSEFLVTLPAVR